MSKAGGFVINNGVLEAYIGKGGDVIVPDGVTSIGDSAFYNRESVKSVVLPASVTSIEKWAFFRCKGLKSIEMSDSITSIGEKAFLQCTSLASVTIPAGVISIEANTFEGCKSIETLVIPKNVARIGSYAFSDCVKLRSVQFSTGITSIGESAFVGCKALADENGFVIVNGVLYDCDATGGDIIIPDSVTGIDKWVLAYHSKISELVLPGTIKYIRQTAFKDTTIEHFVLPKNITVFDDSALELILNHFFATDNKMAVISAFLDQLSPEILRSNKVKRKIIANKNRIIEKAIKADDSEQVSKLFALFDSVELEALNEYIDLSENATAVKAFLLNYKNENYTEAEQEAHENNKLEKELGLKERSVEEWRKIYKFDVENNEATIVGYKGTETNVIIPENFGSYKVAAIGKLAFSPEVPRLKKVVKETRKNIKSIHIPCSVKKVDKGAFYRCEGLANGDGLVIVNGVLYSYHGMWKKVVVPEGVIVIDENAFRKGRRIAAITIPYTVTSIGEDVFSSCKALTIYGVAGSFAEKYAIENNIPFISV